MISLARLGLTSAQLGMLAQLREQETLLAEIKRHYDPYWIKKDFKDIDKQIAELFIKKAEIEKRSASSQLRSAEVSNQLAANKKKQIGILTQNGLLGKLKKAVKAIEEVENEPAIQAQG